MSLVELQKATKAARERKERLYGKPTAKVIPLVIKTVVNDQPPVPVEVPTIAEIVDKARKSPSVDLICSEVARYYDIELAELLSERRSLYACFPRHVAMYLCKELTPMSWTAIGRSFGRDHSTILNGWKNISRDLRGRNLEGNPKLAMDLREINTSIRERSNG
jgi:chromosomal replication initiation ATPase DnaA